MRIVAVQTHCIGDRHMWLLDAGGAIVVASKTEFGRIVDVECECLALARREMTGLAIALDHRCVHGAVEQCVAIGGMGVVAGLAVSSSNIKTKVAAPEVTVIGVVAFGT